MSGAHTNLGALKPAQTVRVELGDARSYDILIGRGLVAGAAEQIESAIGPVKLAIVADENVMTYAESLASSLAAKHRLLGAVIKVPAGEASKSYGGLKRVTDALLDLGLERSHAVIALGGGVVGDLAGFAAAILKRGVKLVQIPTTLLAQVDSSVGGKTGINTEHGKNLIGAFHRPSLVLADLGVLETLPAREFRSGYAEVAKYGVLGDEAFFAWLEANRPRVFELELDALSHAVTRSCQMKAGIVGRDERESGERALLNLGHTFGHAIEAWANYSGLVLHGEAVALGMVLAAEYSHRAGLCLEAVPERIRAHLKACGFAVSLADLKAQTGSAPSVDEMLAFMEQDKKVRDGKMTFILLRAVGHAFIAHDVARSDIRAFLASRAPN